MHQTYSSSVSPFQAYTGTPRAAMAAAAWSYSPQFRYGTQCSQSASPGWRRCCRRTRSPRPRAPAGSQSAPRSGSSCGDSRRCEPRAAAGSAVSTQRHIGGYPVSPTDCYNIEHALCCDGCLGRAVLLPEVHQAGHLVLGQRELLPAPVGQGDVSCTVQAHFSR